MTRRPCSSGGRNGIGGAGMTLAMPESSSGAASAASHEGVDRVGRRGQDQHPADDRADLLEPEAEPGRDAEVAAAAADRPEQVRVRLGVHAEELAVGGDDLGGEEVVDREAVLADEDSRRLRRA